MPDEPVDIANYLDAVRIDLFAMLEVCGRSEAKQAQGLEVLIVSLL
jgi:hypothetical protein